MSALRKLLGAAGILAALASPAAAQSPLAPTHPAPVSAVEFDPPVTDRMILVHGILDQFEGRSDGRTPELRWSGQGWVGTDYDKFWVKTEGFRRRNGSIEDGRHEFLYSRAISTYFDFQGGLRTDLDSGPVRNWASFGIQGLTPLFFDLEATGYVSDRGFAARLEASYDLLITQQLILEPEIELDFYSHSDRARLIGAGLSEIDTGVRLRYEFHREFAPYIGVAYEGKFGQTASFARRAGENTSGVRFVFGIRSWF